MQYPVSLPFQGMRESGQLPLMQVLNHLHEIFLRATLN
ncbi:hypothetical protein PSE_0712 [Pseudovibrio sp. FO-BEG1]|nr:hypothetical protein PSE_0712 [Pseudovibrio sp. FO-BEG1]